VEIGQEQQQQAQHAVEARGDCSTLRQQRIEHLRRGEVESEQDHSAGGIEFA
jgi:hypothetical protein